MLFREELNENNKVKLVVRIQELGDINICYEKEPQISLLMSLKL